VGPDAFQEQLTRVASRYGVMSLSALGDRLREPGCESRPKVCLTVDDGFVSFVDHVLPLLRRLSIPATVFIVPGLLGQRASWMAGEEGARRLMDEGHLEVLRKSGIELGGHGWTHRDLTACGDQELDDEVGRCGEYLRQRWDQKTPWFCYPYAQHDERVRKAVGAAGFVGAVAGGWNRVQRQDRCFEVGRLGVSSDDRASDVEAMLKGGHGWWRKDWWRYG
jgi:peptidoglycan/xylan/chitin deacetylase (PgdA/CDA1 family)